jgi:transposase
MQGYKPYQEKLFSTVNLREMIPDNHLLVRIDKEIDFSFIYDLTKGLYCHDNGRPSIDPVLFFRMQIVGYLFDIQSDRQLCEEIHLNIAYRWFCQLNLEDKVPDHSSLTKIRDRFGVETFQNIFETLIIQWKKEGIINGKRMMSDASLVEANASMGSLIKREDGDPNAKELKKYERRYHDFNEGKKERKFSNQTHVSKTDPDATFVSRKSHYKKLNYKTHYSIDADSRIIVDCYATTGSKHECTILPERAGYILNRFAFTVKEWIADKGYGRGPTYEYFRKNTITTYIPLHNESLGEGKISRGEFQYDRENDRYLCPAGHYLYPYEKLEHGIMKRYRIKDGHCKTCPLRKTCLPDKYQHRSRFIYRSPHQDEIDEIKLRQNTLHFKKKLAERMWKIEGLFAEAKQNHCLRRAKYRGVVKFQIQCYMIAMVQNFKRLISLFLCFLYSFFMQKELKNPFYIADLISILERHRKRRVFQHAVRAPSPAQCRFFLRQHNSGRRLG